MVAVHQLVKVLFGVVIADARHRIAVLPDRQFQQLHFGRRHDVGVVAVRHDLLNRYGADVIDRASVALFGRMFVIAIHIFP